MRTLHVNTTREGSELPSVSRRWWKFEDGVVSKSEFKKQSRRYKRRGDYAMQNRTMGATDLLEGSEWLDRLERQVRCGVRQILQKLIEQEVTAALGRLSHGRAEGAKGYRPGP